MGNLLWVFFSLSPPNSTCLFKWNFTLAPNFGFPNALTIPVFSVSSGWLRLLQQVSCLLCVFFSGSTFPTFLCRALLSQAPPPLPSLLFSVILYLSLPSSFPVSGRPSFGSARLSGLLHVLSHSLKGKIFFHSPFLFLRFAIVVLLFFHSTVLMAQQKPFSGRSHDDFDI